MAHFCDTNNDCKKCAWSVKWDNGEDDGYVCNLHCSDITFKKANDKPCGKSAGDFYKERKAV